MDELASRRAVVTGGASGIGRALTARLASEGMSVVAADIDVDGALETAARLAPAPVEGRRLDVADPASVAAFADWIVATGGVDLLVCNAGVAAIKPFLAADDADWEWILGINLLGAARTIRALLPTMIDGVEPGSRHIVCTASMSSLRPGRLPGTALYCASKFALLGMCESLRGELEPHGIGLTVALPGPVATDIAATTERLRPGSMVIDGSARARSSRSVPPLTPERVADLVVEGVRRDRTYVATHRELWPEVETVHRRIRDAFLE